QTHYFSIPYNTFLTLCGKPLGAVETTIVIEDVYYKRLDPRCFDFSIVWQTLVKGYLDNKC
ncbi:MAG: hypothetical protein ACRCTE_09565, partial [Cellulosilyticaceae bacterium]